MAGIELNGPKNQGAVDSTTGRPPVFQQSNRANLPKLSKVSKVSKLRQMVYIYIPLNGINIYIPYLNPLKWSLNDSRGRLDLLN